MPAFANVVANDYGNHGSTIVTHTFVPNQIDTSGVAFYVEAGASSLDDKKVSCQWRKTADNGRIKVTIKLTLPVTATETINGVASPKLLRTAIAELTLSADASSSVQEREDLLVLMRNIATVNVQPGIVFVTNSPVY